VEQFRLWIMGQVPVPSAAGFAAWSMDFSSSPPVVTMPSHELDQARCLRNKPAVVEVAAGNKGPGRC
jgi:predicted dehydrogenase